MASAWPQRQRWRERSTRFEPRKPLRHADAIYDWLVSKAVTFRSPTRTYLRHAEDVLAHESRVKDLKQAAFKAEVEQWQEASRRGRLERPDERRRALTLAREAGRRAWGLNAYREQIAAAWALLDGRMAEMATGEGKTLVAAIAAAMQGSHGRGCHVVTVNDYLAQRDAEWSQPFLKLCGLSVGYVVGDTEPQNRAEGYAADVTYTTQQNAAADFLRDQLAEQQLSNKRELRLPSIIARQLAGTNLQGISGMMRGLEFAIVDEADSVLLDEAVTPLIISGTNNDPARAEAFITAAQLAQQLEADQDFRLDQRHRDLRLTKQGEKRIDQLYAEHVDQTGNTSLPGGQRFRREMLHQALTARHFFLRGDQYVIQDGKIVIVDSATGRLMPDRTWRAGLHQAVEAKEGVEIQGIQETHASISFQRFFRSYRHLAGMTGTAWNDRAELWRTYRLRTVSIPTHRPCLRQSIRSKPFATADKKWDAVVKTTQQYHQTGQPVLIGTRSVEDSETLSQRFDQAGLLHVVLNALHHERETQIVAQAGQRGKITIATNMAGRGTDIKLGKGMAELGGLVVIAVDRHDSPRVDRQLQGRSARQGQPGVAITLVSLQDPLPRRYLRRAFSWARRVHWFLPSSFIYTLLRLAQASAARSAAHQRRQVQIRDEQLAEQVGY